MHILTAILLRCYAHLGWRHCDVTVLLACPQRHYRALAAMPGRPVSAATSLRLLWACSKLCGDLGDLGDLTTICSAATALYEISKRPSGDQRRSGRFCRSQRGHRPVWLGYYSDDWKYMVIYIFKFVNEVLIVSFTIFTHLEHSRQYSIYTLYICHSSGVCLSGRLVD